MHPKKITTQTISVAFFLGLWHLVAFTGFLSLPTPVEVIRTFLNLIIEGEPVIGRTLGEHAVASLGRVVEGSVIAFALAIPLGILMGWFSYVEHFAESVIEVIRPIPPLAWIPLSYIIFSSYQDPIHAAQIFIVFLGAFFPALISTVSGAKGVDNKLVDVARTLGARDVDVLRKIVIPSSIPAIVTGVRIGLGVGWMCIVAAEMIGGSGTGLGYFIMIMYYVGGRTPEIIAGMLMIGLIGYVMNRSILIAERRALRWR